MVILSKNPKAFRCSTAQSMTGFTRSSSQRQQCQANSCKHLDDNPVLQVEQRNAILYHGLSCDRSNAETLLNSSCSSKLKQIRCPSVMTSVSAPSESSVSFSTAADSVNTLSSDTHLTGASSDPSPDANSYGGLKNRSSMPSIRPNAMKNRLHQLEILKKYEEKYRASANSGDHGNIRLPRKRLSINPLCVHTVDLDNVLIDGSISWLPIQKPDCSICPEETIFYSLVEGRGEIILFGGICGDLHSMEIGLPSKMQAVNNSVFYLSFMKHIN